MKKLISVIICTHNRCESIKDTLDSLLGQEFDGSFSDFGYEVILADNNSKDETKKVVESYKDKFNGTLTYLFEARQGKSHALNTAIDEAKGEIVSFIDDDCMAEERWLSKIWQRFSEDKALDGILGSVIWSDGEKMFVKRNMIRGNGGNMSFRNKTLRELGGFDINLGRGSIGCSGEDTDFVYRAKRRNKNVQICTEITVVHKQRVNVKVKLRYIYRDYKGRIIFWLKYVLKEKDLVALKNIYWLISGVFFDLLNAVKKKDRENIKLKTFQLSGMLAGLIKGVYIWLILAPLKTLWQK